MGYTDDERSAAVSELVQGTLDFSTDRLGIRNVETPYEGALELLNSALFYDPDAIFYLLLLVAQNLKREVNSEIATCEELLAAVDDLAWPNKPINSVRSISDASTSLQVMDGALSRSGAIGDEEYKRFLSATSRAVSALGDPIKMVFTPRGAAQPIRDVVRTSSEAKTATLAALDTLSSSHNSTMDRVGWMISALDDFLAAQLSSKVGQKQVQRAAAQMSALHEELDPLTPLERAEKARLALLKVMTTRGVVKKLAEPPNPTAPRLVQVVSATPEYRLSSYGSGTAPKVLGSESAPWPLLPSGVLGMTLNGTVVDVPVTPGPPGQDGIVVASVIGNNVESFAIHGDISVPDPLRTAAETYDTQNNGNLVHIRVDGEIYQCALTVGLAQTAANIRADLINPANWTPSQPSLTFTVVGTKVVISYNMLVTPAAYSDRSMEILQLPGYAQDLWPFDMNHPSGSGTWGVGSATRGWDANNILWVHPNDYNWVTPIEVHLPEGPPPDFLVSAASVITAINTAATTSGEVFEGFNYNGRVGIRSSISGGASILGEGAVITIRSEGLYSGGGRSGLGTPSFRGMNTLGFGEGQEDRQKDVSGFSVLKALNEWPDFNERARARLKKTVYYQSTMGIGTVGVISVQTDTDPSTGWTTSGLKLVISGGENRGVYGVYGFIHMQIMGVWYLLLGLMRDLRIDDLAARITFELYTEFLEVESNDASVTGEVTFYDPVNTVRVELGMTLVSALATVNQVLAERFDPRIGWLPFDLRGRGIQAGDQIESITGQKVTEVVTVPDLASGLMTVDPEQQGTGAWTTFQITSASLRSYLSFLTSLKTWGKDYQKSYASLDVLVKYVSNELMIGQVNPTKVNAIYSRVDALKTALEELVTIISGLSVRRKSKIDTALNLLLEQGMTRIRDLLLMGRIKEFFAAGIRTASYGNAALDAISKVFVADLNQSSAARTRFSSEFRRQRAQWEEEGDYLLSDLEEEPLDDELEELWPGVEDEGGG
jgi:hypothetical protein